MLSFLIPAYNEANSISSTIAKVTSTLEKCDVVYELLVIDDGSKDDTYKIATEAGVTVIQHPTNRGYGRALKTGLQHAKYDWIAIVDADGTYPIDEFPVLLEHIPAFDMVVGARTGKHFWGGPRKRIGRIMLHSMLRYVIGDTIPDANSGMRVFRKSIALQHISRISSGFSFTTTLTLAMFLDEHFVKYVPIPYYERVGKSKVKLGVDSLRMLQILTMASLFYNPLKLFLFVCGVVLFLSIAFTSVALIFTSLALPTMIFAVGIFISILVGSLGLVAEALRLHTDR